MTTILQGFGGAGLALLVFLAGMAWERHRSRGKQPGDHAAPELPKIPDTSGQAPARSDAQAELTRRMQWQEWLNFLYYDGSPSGDSRPEGQ